MPAVADVPLEQIQRSIIKNRHRVIEFRFIAEACQKLGVRCWLFGGTAAGYAHYVYWDELQKSGTSNLQPNRFDYEYPNIYRSNQDLDLVVEGSAEQLSRLQSLFIGEFPYLQGEKSTWELRPLKRRTWNREAILGDFDFQNQHTDTQSTGLIELTVPAKGESVIRDARNWNAEHTQFLIDVHTRTIRYLFSSRHKQTTRAKKWRQSPNSFGVAALD